VKIFLDACLLIYLNTVVDEEESNKLYEFYANLLKEELCVDMLVLDETIYISKKKYGLSYSDTLNFLEDNVMPFVEVIPLERKDFKLMKKYLKDYKIKPSDALHLAAMDKVGCNTIASEDEEFDKTHIKRIWLI